MWLEIFRNFEEITLKFSLQCESLLNFLHNSWNFKILSGYLESSTCVCWQYLHQLYGQCSMISVSYLLGVSVVACQASTFVGVVSVVMVMYPPSTVCHIRTRCTCVCSHVTSRRHKNRRLEWECVTSENLKPARSCTVHSVCYSQCEVKYTQLGFLNASKSYAEAKAAATKWRGLINIHDLDCMHVPNFRTCWFTCRCHNSCRSPSRHQFVRVCVCTIPCSPDA